MHFLPKAALCLSIILSLSACGGGSSGSPSENTNPSQMLSGTAAAGAAIDGEVQIKGSQGKLVAKVIDANGGFSIDVSDLTPPYLLQARGTVAGREYVLSNFAANTSQNTNITPLTDLILANSLQQEPHLVFASGAFAQLDVAVLVQQELELRQRLEPLLSAAGVSSSTSLLAGEFVADHSGLDLVLDLIDIESKADSSVKILVNRLDQTRIEDDIAQSGETDQIQVPQNLTEVEQAIKAIELQLQAFAALYSQALPTTAQLTPLFSASFLNSDIGLAATLNELSSDSDLQALKIDQLLIKQIDLATNTAEVSYRLSLNNGSRAYIDWQLLRNGAGVWQFNGNQEIVSFDVFFYCSYGDNISNNDCNLWVQIKDLQVSSVDGVDSLVKSARMQIIEQGQRVEGEEFLYGDNLLDSTQEQVLERLLYSGDYESSAFFRLPSEIHVSILGQLSAGSEIQVELYDRELGIDQENEKLQIAGDANLVASYKHRVLAKPLSLMPIDKRFVVAPAQLEKLRDLSQNEINIDWQLPSLAFNGIASFTFTGSNGEQLFVDKDIRFDPSKQEQNGSISLALNELELPAEVNKVELQLTAANVSNQLFDTNYSIDLDEPAAAWHTSDVEATVMHFDAAIGAGIFYLNPNGTGFSTYESMPAVNHSLSWSLDTPSKLQIIETAPESGEQSYLEFELLKLSSGIGLNASKVVVKRSTMPIVASDIGYLSGFAAQLDLHTLSLPPFSYLFKGDLSHYHLVHQQNSACSDEVWQLDYLGWGVDDGPGYFVEPCLLKPGQRLSHISLGIGTSISNILGLINRNLVVSDVISLVWVYPDNTYRVSGRDFSLFKAGGDLSTNCLRDTYFNANACTEENRAYLFWGPTIDRAEEKLEELNNPAP